MSSLVHKVVARYREAGRYMPFAMPRESLLPAEVRDKQPFIPEGTDLAIWTWEDPKGRPHAICFQAKQNKPLWNFYFGSESQRQHRIDETVKSRRESLAYKQKQVDEKKNYQHPYKPGDVFYTSWGYDQTNVDFYEITDVRGKILVVRAIGSKVVRSDDIGSYENVVAVPGKFVGPPLRVSPSPHGVKIEGHYGHLWDGKPKHQTGPYGGH